MFVNQTPKQAQLFKQWQMMVMAQIRQAQAERAQQEREYPLAIWLSEEAYRLCDAAGYPQRLPAIQFQLAQTYHLQGNYLQAHEVWSTLLTQSPSVNPTSLAEIRLACALLEIEQGVPALQPNDAILEHPQPVPLPSVLAPLPLPF